MEGGGFTVTAIKNAKVVLENGILYDGVILVENGRIAAVGDAREMEIPTDAECIDAGGAYVGPGFVDLHCHGGNGSMFYSNPEKTAEHFLSHGATTILATLYYDLDLPDMIDAIDRIELAMKKGAGRAIGGIYMEGPYMNPKFGASPEKNKWRGEIVPERFVPLVDRLGSLAKVWAVAPEREGLEPFMAYAKKVNIDTVFAVGHSEASPKQVAKLKKYGVRLQTHCMDATGRVTTWAGTRACGPDEACMLDNDIYAELICDSMAVHVNPELQRIILKNKGIDKVVLISDSFVSNEVAPPGLAHVTDLSFDSLSNLSGSRLTMDMACRNIMRHTNCGIAQAFLLASRNPARAIGMDDEIGTVEAGKKANLVFVDDIFNVKNVMLEGELLGSAI